MTITAITERQRALFYIYKKQNIAKRFYIQNKRHFAKIKTICVMFLYTKIQTLYVTQFFMKCLELVEGGGGVLYAKNNALCAMFFNTKR